MKALILFLAILSFHCAWSQDVMRKSILQEESEHYSSLHLKSEEQFDSLQSIEGNYGTAHQKAAASPTCTLNKKVFGWHPYWSGNAYLNYQWNLLSDLCYFDYTASPSTGNNTNNSFAWNTASVVTVAKNNGTKIHICATMFSSHSTFWASPSAQSTFISNIVSLLNARQGNGVNIDFEGMGAADKTPFTAFITNLNTALNNANPNYQLSVCLYAVEWSSVFDISALNSQVDFYTVMGYDYYYSGSAQAGPTSPLYNFQTTYNYTISKSITYWLKQGIPQNKLVMGLPYYGREWEVTGNTVPANTTGNFNASRTLAYINNNPSTYTATNKYWEGNCYSPYYKYVSGGTSNRQCFIDDVYSLGRKYDMVNQRGIAGIGIWALGYDAGMNAYWDLLQDKFSSCAPLVCSDSLFDMGGPTRNYYDNEKYEYTLTAPTGSLVQLQFKSFGTELNYDSLWLYNGSSTLSPLMGAYTGTNSPGTVTSSAQSLTLRFKSDGGVVSFGFKAIRSCIPQIISGLSSPANDPLLRVYPNPSNSEFFIEGNVEWVSLKDIFGKEVLRASGESPVRISAERTGLASGIYFAEIKCYNGAVRTVKLIYQR